MTQFIAIDGRGGSGKTHISDILAERLDVAVFHLDEYGNDFEPFIGIPVLIEDLRKVTADTVIYEGVGVFDARFDEFHSFRIFIETSSQVRESRVAGRDTPRADRSVADWQKIFAIWDEAEKAYFTPELIESARLIINGDTDVDIEEIVQQVNRR